MSTEHFVTTISNIKNVWDFYNILPIGIDWQTSDIVYNARNSLSLSRATTYRYLKMLENKGLVEVIGRGTRKLINNSETVIDVRKKGF